MKLNEITIEVKRQPHASLESISALLKGVDLDNYKPYIWEPTNRVTLGGEGFMESVERDPYLIPVAEDRDQYFEGRDVEYWISGLTDYRLMVSYLAKFELNTTRFKHLDIGCSSGRVSRHTHCQSPEATAYGCDLNGQTILWLHQNIPELPAFQNCALPQLPFEDNSLDCVTAYSVLTHIDDFEDAWLLEIRRVLKKGGVALISNHGDHVWNDIDPEHFMYERMVKFGNKMGLPLNADSFKASIPGERLAIYTGNGEANRIAMFRSDKYIKQRWGIWFSELEIVQRGHLFHDLVVLRK